ncbi:MAG: protein translocase subunit SecD [Rhodospirillaceae bacterium]|nr:protein translocase subunit SecD [Rhodospirillaceae bacterium]MCA8932122.1 protein translocase subunit SecD [Rhodospirillaceae bacterium]
MVYFARWKIILIVALCLLGVVYAAPNVVFDRQTSTELRESLPGFLPVRQVNLGLDLQGGSHLLLRVDWSGLVRERLEAAVDSLPSQLREAQIGYTDRGLDGDALVFTLRDPTQADAAVEILQNADADLDITVDEETGQVRGTFDEGAQAEIRDNAVDQSIEIVRRRIDELGTTEPNIQRQGDDRILVQIPGFDDPQRVRDLLGQTARLTFHLVDTTASAGAGPGMQVPAGRILVPSSDLRENGDPATWYVLHRRVEVSGENLVQASATYSQGSPVVSFTFDGAGGRRFGTLTSENVGGFLAIVLDDEVISAPRINSAILGGSGIIEGHFSLQEATDLAILLRAGALPAPLTVLEERTVGPGLGADSIAAGEIASIIGLVAVVVFMVLCYGLFGVMASVALFFNLALVIAALSLLQATLTLPGIAGIVLTVGMAVDANVLIFERIREEIANGRSPISAIDSGYARALTTIVDSNLTTLIAGVLLFAMGAGPVRGFAVTLSIGIVSSMFAGIMVTRLMVVTWLRRTKPKSIPI